MPHVRIQVLGQFALWREQQPVSLRSWGSRYAQHLVKLLALVPTQRLRLEAVTDALWPDADPTQARRSFYQVSYIARTILDPDRHGLLSIDQEQITLGPPGTVEVDLQLFLAASRQALQRRDIADYISALALYTGPLLPADLNADWAFAAREQAQQTYLHLLAATATAYQEQGNLLLARQTWERLLAVEPVDETAHTALIELALAQDEPQQALQQYQLLATTLKRELDLAPGPEMQQLYARIRQGNLPPKSATTPTTTAPAARPVASAPPRRLPIPLTPLFGREEAVQAVHQCLEQYRLVTLAGPGGVGKTRLALAAAQAAQEAGADLWWVELAPLADPAHLLPTVADVVGVQSRPDQPLLTALLAWAETTTATLVLDNCEHLLTACADLVTTLLTHSAGVRVLATSRTPLRVAGEIVWRVPALPVPATVGAAPTVAELRTIVTNPAAQIILTTVHTRHPEWTLPRQHVAALVTVCQQVAGVPLALELAAGRLTTLPLPQLAQRLQQALLVLADGPRSAPTRQQTLRATLDWSYQLLPPADQQLLAELSVFAGGWTLEAAEAVCTQGAQVLPGLASLVEQSLVQVGLPNAETGQVRYQLLETVRQYALEQLVMLGQEAALRERHAAQMTALATAVAPQLTGPGMLQGQEQLTAELQNLRAALSWWVQTNQAEPGLHLATILDYFWQGQGQEREGLHWLTVAFAGAQTAVAPLIWARALLIAGRIAVLAGLEHQAQEWLLTALPLLRAADERLLLADVLHALAAAATLSTDDAVLAAGWDYEREALQLYQELQLPVQEVIAHHGFGVLAYTRGDYAVALTYITESLQRCQEIQAVRLMPTLFSNAGHIQITLGQREAGLRNVQAGLAHGYQQGDRRLLHNILLVIAWATAADNPTTAAACLGAAQGLRKLLKILTLPNLYQMFELPAETTLRATLGPEAYAAALAAGQQWDFDIAFDHANKALEAALATCAKP